MPDRRIYATWITFPLARAEHGVEGKLRALEDSRVTKPGSPREGTHPMIPPCDLLPTRLEVLEAGGRVLDHQELSPEVNVIAHAFAKGQTLYETVELVHCLASCWCGNAHGFWLVRDAKLRRLATRRESGAVAEVPSVNHNCYEESGIGRRDGKLELTIKRTAVLAQGAFAAEERHWFDGNEWRGSIVERKIEW